MKRKYRYGYKVVRRRLKGTVDFELSSAFPQGHRVSYEMGYSTQPRKEDGPLAVFATMKDAVLFITDQHIGLSLEIYRCKYIPYKGTRRLWKMHLDDRSNRMRKKINAYSLPKGTRLATEVILTSFVRRGKWNG